MNARKLAPLLLVIAGLLAWHNSFTGPFIFDDVGRIQENPIIRHLWPIWDVLSPPSSAPTNTNGRPIVNLSLAVNYAFGGYNLWGWHALNLTIHILAGLTLLGIVRRTLRQPPLRERFGATADGLALAVALIWTVHPLQTESVTYIIQRAESIMGLFYLLTLYCFIRGAASDRPRPWYSLCVTACALGMASKEVMASAPLMVMLYDRAFVSGSFREAWRRRWPLYLALSATWILLGLMVVSAGTFAKASTMAQHVWGVTRWEYLLTEPGVILHYLRLAVWPYPLCFDYYGWPLAGTGQSVLLPTLVIAILLGATAWTCKTNSAWGFLGAWFFLILAPSSSIIPLDSPAYEHRMYLSLAAIVTGLVVVAFVLGKRLLRNPSGSVLGWMACGFVVVTLVILTIQRNRDYASDFAIWQDTVAKCPQNPRAHLYLGLSFEQTGRLQEAFGQFAQALRLKPDYAQAHLDLGGVLLRLGSPQEAAVQCQEALRLMPDLTAARVTLGNALLQMGKEPEAIAEYEQVLRTDPDFAEVYSNLGVALAQTGKIEEAIAHYQQALRIKPDDAEAHYNLGMALAQTGKIEDAIAHYEQALRIKPDYAEAHFELGNVFLHEGKVGDAIGHYEQALRISPDYAEAHNNLGLALAQTGKIKEAITHYERSLQINPRNAGAHFNLGNALMQLGRVPGAIAHYQQVLEIDPKSAGAHYNLANALFRVGKVTDAITEYGQSLQIDPGNADAHSKLGAALIATGNVHDALGQLEQALRINPDLTEAQNNLAWVLATLPPADGGDPVRAVALAQRVCERSGHRAPGDLDTLAVAYAAAGRFDDAIATARTAIDLARAAGQAELVKEVEARLELYRNRNAYHPSTGATNPSNP